jgi:hypothetical protein
MLEQLNQMTAASSVPKGTLGTCLRFRGSSALVSRVDNTASMAR